MTVFWWISGIALALTAGATAFFFLLYITRGEDRYLELSMDLERGLSEEALRKLARDIETLRARLLSLQRAGS